MPFPNQHAARVRNPGDFVEGSFVTLTENMPKGLSIITGKLKDGGALAAQSIRFSRENWTTERARKWLDEHDYEGATIEEATGEERGDSDDDYPIEEFIHTDQGQLQKSERTAEGFLRVDARLAKPTILTYFNPDGSKRRELVTKEVLADPAHLESYRAKPVTSEHPRIRGSIVLLDPKTAPRFSRGAVDGSTRMDSDGYQRASLLVTDARLIRDIEAGKVEVSPGYKAKVLMRPGVHPTLGKYDGKQIHRTGNHVAVTDAARGGRDIRLRADSAASIGGSMDPEKLIEYLIGIGVSRADAEERAKELSQARADADDFKAKFEEMKGKHDALVNEMANLKKDHADALDKIKGFEEKADKRTDSERADDELSAHKAWAEQLAIANEFEVEKADSMDIDAMREAIVRKRVSKLAADATPEQIEARYDILMEDREERTDSNNEPSNKRAAAERPIPAKKPRKQVIRMDSHDAWGSSMDRAFEANQGGE